MDLIIQIIGGLNRREKKVTIHDFGWEGNKIAFSFNDGQTDGL